MCQIPRAARARLACGRTSATQGGNRIQPPISTSRDGWSFSTTCTNASASSARVLTTTNSRSSLQNGSRSR